MAFHFRVRDGNGWVHHARITRGSTRLVHIEISNDPIIVSSKNDAFLDNRISGKMPQTSLAELNAQNKKPDEY